MKRKIVRLVVIVSVLFAFTGCMGFSHLGHSGGGTSYQSDSHASHQSGGGSHSGGFTKNDLNLVLKTYLG